MKNYEAICHYLENKIKTFKIRQSRKNVASMQNWPFIISDLFKLSSDTLC